MALISSFSYSVFGISRYINPKRITICKLNDDSHVILDPMVPYVGQGNDSYCMYASTTMQIKYFCFNITLPKILHDFGHGYIHLYSRFLPPSRIPFGGSGISTSNFNMELLADGYNLIFNDKSSYRTDVNISL